MLPPQNFGFNNCSSSLREKAVLENIPSRAFITGILILISNDKLEH